MDSIAAISETCFSIPCASLDVASDPHSYGFAPDPIYEADSRAAAARKKAFDGAWATSEAAIDRALHTSHSHLAYSLSTWATDSRELALQASSSTASTSYAPPEPLRASLLVGPTIDEDGLPLLVERSLGGTVVRLDGAECSSLPAAIALIIARALPRTGSDADRDAPEPEDLAALRQALSGRGCQALSLHLTSPSTIDAQTLSDLICALHASLGSPAFDGDGTGHLPFLLVLQEGASPNLLLDSLSHHTLALVEVERMLLPSAQRCWDDVIRELYLEPLSQSPPVLLGSRTLSFIRSHSFENDTSAAALKSAIKLALLHHFTSRPLSGFVSLHGPSDDAPPDRSAWQEPSLTRLRLSYFSHLVEADDSASLLLPPRSLWPKGLKPETDLTLHAQGLIEDDAYAIDMVSLYRAEWERAGWERRLGTALLRHLQGAASGGWDGHEDEEGAVGSGRDEGASGAAEIYIASLSCDPSSPAAARVRRQIKLVCDQVRDLDLARLASVNRGARRWLKDEAKVPPSLRQWWEDWSEGVVAELDKHSAALDADDEDSHDQKRLRTEGESEQQRFERVSRLLRRNEEAKEVKAVVARWWQAKLSSWLLTPPTSLPLSSLWLYDSTSHLSSLLDASPRSSLLVALADPSAYLPLDSPTPDVSRAWGLQADAGRLVNLADWMGAFGQALKAEEEEGDGAPRGRGRKSGKPARQLKNDREQAQVRFAAAVNHLVAMGFLKRTARRPEHVMRTVFDLAPRRE